MNSSLQRSRDELQAYALTLPGTREDHPWGERVAKVGDKVFVFFGKSRPHEPMLQFAVKLPHSGLAALDLGFTEPTGYGMGKHGWVTATFRDGERPDLACAKAWVLESYRAIAPKKLVALLDGEPPPVVKRRAPKKSAPRSPEKVAQKSAEKSAAPKRKSAPRRVTGKQAAAAKASTPRGAAKAPARPKARGAPKPPR
ncbi:MAG: MmcQ/YjbR family DNA-binding protein [Planctomycetes bacterium]|nr:MmcQ/YjbR family DNA-binding protein [Planctomycetota bacterium]